METLPIEIQLGILSYITDLQTLGNLIHAAPAFHRTYLSVRNEVLTNVTIHELAARSINILSPNPVCELALNLTVGVGSSQKQVSATRGRSINEKDTAIRDAIIKDVAEAMHTIYIYQLEKNRTTTARSRKVRFAGSRKLTLDVKHCLALLRILNITPWRVTYEKGRATAWQPGTGLLYKYDRYCFHWACRHLIHIALDKDRITERIESDWIWPAQSPFAVDNGRLIQRVA